MTFLRDEMLVRRGRWLRAAGCDTAIAAPGTGNGSPPGTLASLPANAA